MSVIAGHRRFDSSYRVYGILAICFCIVISYCFGDFRCQGRWFKYSKGSDKNFFLGDIGNGCYRLHWLLIWGEYELIVQLWIV